MTGEGAVEVDCEGGGEEGVVGVGGVADAAAADVRCCNWQEGMYVKEVVGGWRAAVVTTEVRR